MQADKLSVSVGHSWPGTLKVAVLPAEYFTEFSASRKKTLCFMAFDESAQRGVIIADKNKGIINTQSKLRENTVLFFLSLLFFLFFLFK
jgi:hypothetical protein